MASIQICQPGFDVRTCPDWAYLFNSDWPSLQIIFETTVVASGGNGATINHNFGYVPLTMVWDNSATSYGRVNNPQITNTNIYISDNGNYTIRCFNIDISKDASYPLPTGVQAKLPYDNQFGMKIAKKNESVASNNLNDFILHTRAQSPALLQVATQKGQYYDATGAPNNQPAIVYPFRTSYIPWVWGAFEVQAGNYLQLSPNSFTYNTTNNTIVMNTNSAMYNGGSLVILRDPLFYPNTDRIVY